MNISKKQLLEMLENINTSTVRGAMIKAFILDDILDSHADMFSVENVFQQLFEEFEYQE